ncbi:MAG TPA: iron-containing alcohol dehydrogenase, partial [Pyrodictiaceae archaeon]|nr:iron-containing alcohol dehydrogenase [Pyrodictiaceae archaeon]
MKNFEFFLPTKVFFGKKALNGLKKELPFIGSKALLVFGKSSIFRTGLYEKIKDILNELK